MLQEEHKIDPSTSSDYKGKFFKLHDQLVKNYENEKSLLERGHKLKQDLVTENLKFEKAQS
jgi:hypothetical protein